MRRFEGGSRSGGVLGVILLIVGLFAVVVAMAVFIVVKTVNVRKDANHADRVSIEVPGASIDIAGHKKLDPETIGVPVYPGAKMKSKDSSAGASISWTTSKGKADSISVVGAEYLTPDSADQVAAFYRGKLNNWVFVNKKDKDFSLEITEGRWKRVVGIQEKSDGTHIGVASIGEPAGN